MSMFFYLHGDAVGTGFAVLGLAVVLFIAQDRAHIRQQAGQRATHAALRDAEVAALHDEYAETIRRLSKRPKTLAERAAEALDLTLPRTRLDDSYINQTVDTGATGPVFWDGVNR